MPRWYFGPFVLSLKPIGRREQGEAKSFDDVRDITDITGGFKRWQICILIAVIYFELVSVNIANVTLFLVPANLEFWCASISQQNVSLFNPEKPLDTTSGEGVCWYLDNSTKIECSAWEYDRKTYSSSFVEKWNLVCDKAWLVSFSMTINIIGDFFGCLICGYLSDRIGRRKTMLVTLVPALIGSIGTFFAPGIITFLICRFLCGAAGLGFLTTSFVLLMEIVSPDVRTAIGNGSKVGYTVGSLLLGAAGYFLRYWEYIQLASTIPLCVMIVVCWYIPESPRWLILNNRIDEASVVLKAGARMNGVDDPNLEKKILYLSEYLRKDTSLKNLKNTTSPFDLIKTKNLRIKYIILIIMWLIMGFVSHSLLMNLTVFGKDSFLGPLLIMCAEFPALIAAHILYERIGCKWTNQITAMAMAGVSFVLSFCGHSGYWTQMCLLSVLKFFSAIYSNGLTIHSAEIFPTVARTIGVGSCSMFARVSAMTTPFIKEMSQDLGFFAPFLLMGGLSALASLLVVFLPNTNKALLPETLEDAEKVPLYLFRRAPNEGMEEPMFTRTYSYKDMKDNTIYGSTG